MVSFVYKIQLVLFLSFFVLFANSQSGSDDYVNDNALRYDDYIYKPNIKTVQLHGSQWEFSPALILMNSGEQLELSFDDLDGNQKQFGLTFVHCNADWTPSDLMNSEYMEGFFDLTLLTFTFSMNTLQKYTHYSTLFPASGIKFVKSGNYIVYVYSNGDKKDIVLSRRFSLFENTVNINASLRQTIGGDDQQKKQQIEFSVGYAALKVVNPAKDIKIWVTQNNRWDNAQTNMAPTYYAPNEITYSMGDAAVFNGGNEFRYFDLRSLRVYSERIKEMYKDDKSTNHVILTNDEIRANKQYVFQNDINGSFLIKSSDIVGNQDIEADYAYVDFFLPYPNPETQGNFYIMGKLTDWRMNNTNKMTYNYKRFGYECRLFLKQGYYNYMIVLSQDGKKAGDETVIEGNHWDTENDYTILVYFRQVGLYYDQLVGIKKLNSITK